MQPLRLEVELVAEDLGVGGEGDAGAAAVGGGAEPLDRAERLPLGEALAVELAVARDLDDGVRRQRVTTLMPTPCRPPEVA